jgi:hypothetical protein
MYFSKNSNQLSLMFRWDFGVGTFLDSVLLGLPWVGQLLSIRRTGHFVLGSGTADWGTWRLGSSSCRVQSVKFFDDMQILQYFFGHRFIVFGQQLLVVVVLMQMIFVKHFLGCLDDCSARLVDFDSPTTWKEGVKIRLWNNSIPYPSTYTSKKKVTVSWVISHDVEGLITRQPLPNGVLFTREYGAVGIPR